MTWDDFKFILMLICGGGASGAIVVAIINARSAKPVNEANAAEMSVRGMNNVVGAWELFTKKIQEDMARLRAEMDGLEKSYEELRKEYIMLQHQHDKLKREHATLQEKFKRESNRCNRESRERESRDWESKEPKDSGSGT